MKRHKLGDVCSRLSSGKSIRATKIQDDGDCPVIGGNGLRGYTEAFNFDGECAVIGRQGAACGNVRFHSGKAYMTEYAIVAVANECNDSHYLAYRLSTMHLGRLSAQSAQPGLSVKTLSRQEVDLPSLKEQEQVVAVLGTLDAKIEANARLNGYLAEQCETVVELETGRPDTLSSLCSLVTKKVDSRESDISTYVSTESLLPGKMGRRKASSLPQTGKVTVYQIGDTLISNIRPYFKKIWYADCAGTCSGDVLVFRAKHPDQAGYLYSCMRNDRFFDYVMKGSKGTKMPRGDKKQMLAYEIVSSPTAQTMDLIQTALEQISITGKENDRLVTLRDALLPKLMSGEIDVSKIDLTQLNSHLV